MNLHIIRHFCDKVNKSQINDFNQYAQTQTAAFAIIH
jgi:hypothetical protein